MLEMSFKLVGCTESWELMGCTESWEQAMNEKFADQESAGKLAAALKEARATVVGFKNAYVAVGTYTCDLLLLCDP